MEQDQLKDIFGTVIKELRLKKKLSQEKLALESDLDRTYLSLLERGLRNPTLKVLFAISKTLSVRPSKLVEMVEKQV